MTLQMISQFSSLIAHHLTQVGGLHADFALTYDLAIMSNGIDYLARGKIAIHKRNTNGKQLMAFLSHRFHRPGINSEHATKIRRVQGPELPGPQRALRTGVEDHAHAGLPQRLVNSFRGS